MLKKALENLINTDLEKESKSSNNENFKDVSSCLSYLEKIFEDFEKDDNDLTKSITIFSNVLSELEKLVGKISSWKYDSKQDQNVYSPKNEYLELSKQLKDYINIIKQNIFVLSFFNTYKCCKASKAYAYVQSFYSLLDNSFDDE